MHGGCTCGTIRYRLLDRPLIVHCCHCSWCQRETGSAFALNAVIETDRLQVQGTPEIVLTPSASGQGQRIARCPQCRVALYSFYSRPELAFLRVGTLERPADCPPDIHIFTTTRQPWIILPPGATVVAEYYRLEDVWRPEALRRRQAALGNAAAGGENPQ